MRLTEFWVPDGREKVGVQVPLSVDSNGRVDLHLDEVRALGDYARRLRLENSQGPDARTGVARHETISSLVGHALRFNGSDAVLYANPKDLTLAVIYDYHPSGPDVQATRWCRHRAQYRAAPSDGWAAWGGMGRVSLDQEEFCGLLESRDYELTSGTDKNYPSAGTLLTMAQGLESSSTVRTKRERASNGRMKLIMTMEDGAASEVEVPNKFGVVLPVFTDSPEEVHEVRLSITVKDGQPTFHLEIHRAALEMLETFAELADRVAKEAELPVFVGTPEA